MRRLALGLALPVAVGAPVVLLSGPAEAVTAVVTVSAPTSIVYGQPVTATATVTDGEAPITTGSVQFTVLLSGSGTLPLGSPVPLDANGHATSPVLTQSDGRPLDIPTGSDFWSVKAVYSEGGQGTSGFITVNRATSSVAVLPSATTLVADISGVNPGGSQAGSLLPGGSVVFKLDGATIGTRPAVNGSATLDYVLPPGTQTVTADYSGDSRYTASSGSRVRRDPLLSARVLATFPASKAGWYHTAVGLFFICRPQGSELVEDCPADVSLKKSGRNQSVTRSIHAVDGGAATVTVSGIDIDRDKPVIRINGRSCSATDKLSGVKGRCRMKIAGNGHFVAVAQDKAGNRAVRRGILD